MIPWQSVLKCFLQGGVKSVVHIGPEWAGGSRPRGLREHCRQAWQRQWLVSITMITASSNGKCLNNKYPDQEYHSIFFSRRAIRNRVWEQRINSPLFNVRIYAKVNKLPWRTNFSSAYIQLVSPLPFLLHFQDLEDLFLKMFEKFRKGEKPSHITN